MATWFRAHSKNNALEVFSGDGGLFVSGRWNHLGKKAVYCSSSLALATLEWLSHNGLSVSGFSYFRFSIEVPDHLIKSFDESKLPSDWKTTPANESTKDFATEYLFDLSVLAIAVPSVVIPEEKNLIINPLHPDYAKVITSIKSLGEYIAPSRFPAK